MNDIVNGLIRNATGDDASVLTQIAYTSKRYWRYPEQYFNSWKDELTITRRYISDAKVFIYESGDVPVAFASLSEWKNDVIFKGEVLPAGMWLEHIFVEPAFMLIGIGTALFSSLAWLDGVTRIKRSPPLAISSALRWVPLA